MSISLHTDVELNIRPSCIFYGDLYPNEECYEEPTAIGLKLIIEARKKFAYGAQQDHFDERNCIGFVREGDGTHDGCAVLLSNAAQATGYGS